MAQVTPTLILELQRNGLLKQSRDEHGHSPEYKAYLLTPTWGDKRNQRLKIDGHQCRGCGATENLEVHHIHYDRLGKEDVERDLTTFCKRCHTAIHSSMKRGKRK